MASKKITKSKKKIETNLTKQEIINHILFLKTQPLSDFNKLKIQHLQQQLH